MHRTKFMYSRDWTTAAAVAEQYKYVWRRNRTKSLSDFVYSCKWTEKNKLECGPMPNVMAALPNIGGALNAAKFG